MSVAPYPLFRGVPQTSDRDCLRACVATLLRINPLELPDLNDTGWTMLSAGWERFQAALEQCAGRRLVELDTRAYDGDFLYIAALKTGPVMRHAVVARGRRVVWDPDIGAGYALPLELVTARYLPVTTSWPKKHAIELEILQQRARAHGPVRA